MNRIKHIINGNQSESLPDNNDTLGVKVDFTNNEGVNVDFDSLRWLGTDAESIINFRNGSLGSFVGMPYNMQVGSISFPDLFFDLRKYKQIGCNEVEVGVKFKNQRDWLIREASSLQIARLEDEGLFVASDYVNIPYNRNYIPDELQSLMLALSTYMMAKELYTFIKETAQTINEATAGASGLSPAVVGLSVLNIITRVAYFVAMVVAIVKLIQSIFDNLYSITRHHTGIKLSSIFRVGCTKLGLTFKSTIFNTSPWREMVLLPSETERGRYNVSSLNPAAPKRQDLGLYFFGEFIETMRSMFNADYRIRNGVMRFERWDWWGNNSTYVIPSNWTNQDRLLNEFTDNANEFVGGYTLSFAIDQKDQNTYDNYNGTVYDVITKAGSTLAGYENEGGAEWIDLPIARAKRKDTLTNFEKVLKVLFQLVDAVTNTLTLGNGTSFASQMASRVGNMELSDHFTSIPKIVIMNSDFSKLAPTQITAKMLWDNFHYINSFYEINGKHNQWEIYTIPARFCEYDFNAIFDNNFATTEDGEKVKILSFDWVIEEDQATITYAVNKKYCNNLEQTYIEGENSNNSGNPNV